MNRLRIAVLPLFALALGTTTLGAQEPAPSGELVDRIVAVVGDSVVLKSDLDEEVYRIAATSGKPLPENPEELEPLYREALDARIDELVLLQAAARDSVTVQDNAVAQRVDQEIARRRQAMGGERAFQEAIRQTGLTMTQFRQELESQVRRQGMIEAFLATLQRDRRPPPITDAEARSYFEARSDQIAERPATLSFQQVIVQPRPSDSARAAARAEAEEIIEKLRAGEDFEDLARRYTDEPGGRERAGDLGWFRRGQMVPEFERVAFGLPPGSVSGVVETSFGLHIIKVEKAKGGERQARHILIRPEMTPADVQRTETVAREVAEKLRAGEPLDSLVARYGDPALQNPGSLLAPRVGPVPRDRLSELPGPYVTALADAAPDRVLEPFRLTGIADGNHWVVAKVTEMTESGKYDWDDPEVRSRVREQLERQKLMAEVIAELRDRTYIDIRM